MSPVTVVTDTTCYLPPENVARLAMTLVPLYIVFGPDRTLRESDITDYSAFFEDLRSSDALPTTSQPSPGDFATAYGRLLDEGRDIVSIHISERLSGTSSSARAAADQLRRDGRGGERIRVVDSQTAAGGLGIVALAAATAAAAGASADEVEERATTARSELKMWFAVDTLEFFKRGGRIGAASAWIGSTLKIKPILTIEHELRPIERVRTTARAFERLLAYARQRHDSGFDAWVVQHISAEEQAAKLVESCREVFGTEPLFVSEIGPVLGTHAGPGLLGVGSVSTKLFE